ncbi:protein translocase subunit SecF [Pilimelia columellifera]|uniref:Protein-export membrane protein SecF n=1 Tax=Pilimelia columellifera subsp. columellifera TaxID=706583 RepID=A0ABN3NML1_9ACTN
MSSLATRLYRGEAGVNIVGRRKMWFTVAGVALLLAVLAIGVKQFHLGIEFAGGNQFKLPNLTQSQAAVEQAFQDAGAVVGPVQTVGRGDDVTFQVTTAAMGSDQAVQVKQDVAAKLGIADGEITFNTVSAAWGEQITNKALQGLIIFLIVVMIYLVLRFEWRMAVSAVSSLLLNLILTAGVYALTGFEVTPSTVIGFLTILGFALYDVVVVFDKIQENTRGITTSSTRTYADAANLAVNQTIMRSINTSLVALLPVGGLLFIGAGLLGAGTLKDLSLVLFVGMAIAVYSSLFVATPILVTLKDHEPRYKAHNARVRARLASGREAAGNTPRRAAEPVAVATAAPKPGARPAAKGRRPGPGGRRR